MHGLRGVRDCPAFALELERESREKFRLVHYHDHCAYCGQCQDVCRQGAIRLTSEYMPAAPDRDALRERFGEYSPAPKTTPA